METKAIDKKELLETILEAVEYKYLSDLHSLTPSAEYQVVKIIPHLKWCSYSLDEWTDAVCYLTGKKSVFSTIKEAADYLEHYLTETE